MFCYSGTYLLADASDYTKEGDVMKIFTKEFDVLQQMCVSFSYFMKGDDVGTLTLRQIIRTHLGHSVYKDIWQTTGHQGDKWITQRIQSKYMRKRDETYHVIKLIHWVNVISVVFFHVSPEYFYGKNFITHYNICNFFRWSSSPK